MDGTSRLSDSDSETEIGLIFTREPSSSKEKPKERIRRVCRTQISACLSQWTVLFYVLGLVRMHIRNKWLTLNSIFLIAAFVGIISITILSLWISGIFNTFSQLNTLGNHSAYHSEYDKEITLCNWSMTIFHLIVSFQSRQVSKKNQKRRK